MPVRVSERVSALECVRGVQIESRIPGEPNYLSIPSDWPSHRGGGRERGGKKKSGDAERVTERFRKN